MTTFGIDCTHDTDSFRFWFNKKKFCEARPETNKKTQRMWIVGNVVYETNMKKGLINKKFKVLINKNVNQGNKGLK